MAWSAWSCVGAYEERKRRKILFYNYFFIELKDKEFTCYFPHL